MGGGEETGQAGSARRADVQAENTHTEKTGAFENKNLRKSPIAHGPGTSAESWQWYSLIFEANPQPMIVFDPANLKILEANRAALHCCGVDREEFLTANFRDICSEGARILERIPRDEDISGVAFSCFKRDGQAVDLEITTRNIEFNPGGRESGRRMVKLALINDVTRDKTMEYELLKARKLESVGLLAGGIAHDFNNLLTAILGNISLAKMNLNPGSKLYERLSDAEQASLKAKDLTYQLLTFSKGGDPCKEKTALPGLLREAASQALSGSALQLQLRLDPELWPIEADRIQMKIALQNVISNAREAMPEEGAVTLEADNIRPGEGTFLPLLDEGRYLRIAVRDRGKGIPAENLDKIFDPYFTTKKMGSVKGMGLGLAIVYSIIKKHNGFVGVESAPGEGTNFYIYLPALEEKAPEAPKAAERVLVVDDEEMVREVAGEMLANMGYDVAFAIDGDSAIEIYKKAFQAGAAFDAVILDLTMPGGIRGNHVIKRLQEIDPRVKAIASSGYPDDPVMQDFRKYGYMEAIEKPYRLEDLNRKLHSVLEQ